MGDEEYDKFLTQYNRFPRGIINGNWKDDDGFVKTLFRKSDGRLLGGVVYGDDADNLVQILMVALKASLSTDDLGHLPFFHPSLAEGIRYASRD